MKSKSDILVAVGGIVLVVAVLLLTGCSPAKPVDLVPLQRQVTALSANLTQQQATGASLQAQVNALKAENTALKAAGATFATKADLAAVKPSPELMQFQATVSGLQGQVTTLSSQQASLANNVRTSIAGNQEYIKVTLASQYMTQGDKLALEARIAALEARVAALEAKMVAHGW
jgi:septal ring factor EnvC (AmiA/AmiB activator)